MSLYDETLERLMAMADALAVKGYDKDWLCLDGDEAHAARLDLEALQHAIAMMKDERRLHRKAVQAT